MPTAHQPNNNAESDVVAAVFALERALIARHFPSRQPSTMCAINRSARFRPHLDAGAGFGQRTSLIVGLGDYCGGALVVERGRKRHPLPPLEFDGWRERHWTLPFKGERFSLVWFTPLTVATPVPKPPLPPFVLEACKGDLPAPPSTTQQRLAPMRFGKGLPGARRAACSSEISFLDGPCAPQRDVIASMA